MEIAPLLAMRGFPLSRSGGEMHWRIPGEESVSIRGNMWYSHYRGEGGDAISFARRVPFPVSWTVKMKKKQKETQDILSYHTQAAGCSDKARAKASGGRQPIEECGRTGL